MHSEDDLWSALSSQPTTATVVANDVINNGDYVAENRNSTSVADIGDNVDSGNKDDVLERDTPAPAPDLSPS